MGCQGVNAERLFGKGEGKQPLCGIFVPVIIFILRFYGVAFYTCWKVGEGIYIPQVNIINVKNGFR